METLESPAMIAVDRKTSDRLRQLAAVWKVTPEEALSRAVERVDPSASERPDPEAILRKLHETGGGLDPAVAEAYLEEVCEDRKNWGDR